MEKNNIYESVHNYTKYKLVDMLIKRHQEGRLNLNNLNAIEGIADDILKVLSVAGLKYYSELKGKFDE